MCVTGWRARASQNSAQDENIHTYISKKVERSHFCDPVKLIINHCDIRITPHQSYLLCLMI